MQEPGDRYTTRVRGILLRALLLLLPAWFLLPSIALAEELYIETLGVPSRTEAQALSESAEEDGLEVRLIRRFRRGAGWEYVVRIEGIATRDEADGLARRLALQTETPVTIYLRAGKDILPVGEVILEGDGATIQAPANPDPLDTGDGHREEVVPPPDPVAGNDLLAAVIRAHGGNAEAIFPDSKTLHFRFERKLWLDGGDLRVWHDIWHDGDKMRLEVRILEGDGKDSTTLLRGEEGAWLMADGEVRKVGVGPTREALQAFSPEQVLARALGFSHLDPAQDTQPSTDDYKKQTGLVWLELALRPGESPVVLGVDESDHRVRDLRITTDAGELEWKYSNYHEIGNGFVVPFQVELLKDGSARELITVMELELDRPVDGVQFASDRLGM